MLFTPCSLVKEVRMNSDLYDTLLLGDANTRFYRNAKRWVTAKKCAVTIDGFLLRKCITVYRTKFCPVFQCLLNEVHVGIRRPSHFWDAIRSRSFVELCKKIELPVCVVRNIVTYL